MANRILVERTGPIKTIILTRPEKRNAMDTAMLDALYETFTEPPDPSDRLILLRAEGSTYCAGVDLKERLAIGITSNESPVERVFQAMENHPLPIVTVVEGAAIAGGCELALHCEFIIASEDARFGMSLAQVGLAPTWFLAKKLMEVAGPVRTREILLLGEPLPARWMHKHGLIARAAPKEDLEGEVDKIVNRLAANAPLSLRAMKAMIIQQLTFRDSVAHHDIDELVQAARKSNDSKEGMSARLEKRQPNFTGT